MGKGDAVSPPAPPAFPPVPGSPKHYPLWGNALLSAPDWKSAGATGLWGGQVRSASSQGFGSRKVILLVLHHFCKNKALELRPENPARVQAVGA